MVNVVWQKVHTFDKSKLLCLLSAYVILSRSIARDQAVTYGDSHSTTWSTTKPSASSRSPASFYAHVSYW